MLNPNALYRIISYLFIIINSLVVNQKTSKLFISKQIVL